MNQAIFIGRPTGDLDVKFTQDGNPVVRFGFAVNRIFRREGEPEADFFSCVAFGKTAERMEKLNVKKGTKLLLISEVRNNDYTDKDGQKRRATQIIVNNFEFCESKSANSDGYSAPTPAAPKGPVPPSQEAGFMSVPDDLGGDDLPF